MELRSDEVEVWFDDEGGAVHLRFPEVGVSVRLSVGKARELAEAMLGAVRLAGG